MYNMTIYTATAETTLRVRDMLRDLTDIKNKQLFLQSNRCRITGDDATRQQRERERQRQKTHHP